MHILLIFYKVIRHNGRFACLSMLVYTLLYQVEMGVVVEKCACAGSRLVCFGCFDLRPMWGSNCKRFNLVFVSQEFGLHRL